MRALRIAATAALLPLGAARATAQNTQLTVTSNNLASGAGTISYAQFTSGGVGMGSLSYTAFCANNKQCAVEIYATTASPSLQWNTVNAPATDAGWTAIAVGQNGTTNATAAGGTRVALMGSKATTGGTLYFRYPVGFNRSPVVVPGSYLTSIALRIRECANTGC